MTSERGERRVVGSDLTDLRASLSETQHELLLPAVRRILWVRGVEWDVGELLRRVTANLWTRPLADLYPALDDGDDQEVRS